VNNAELSKKMSFWQVLAEANIEIPKIQRDYAQGREKQKKIRDKFLGALCDALHKQPVELDFIYGSKEKDVFQPLDGQQRLTTLFLLHWYVAINEDKMNDTVKDRLSKFTYETRTTSREFCMALVENGAGNKKLFGSKNSGKENELSVGIKNKAWFVPFWERDPTISAMLVMLDAIHAKFNGTTNLWPKLTDEKNPSIVFWYIELEHFGLSDDLYIKMNARGKQLTAFENFKSSFEKHVEEHKFEVEIDNVENTFSHKIDTVWTDLFWIHKDEENTIDEKLINFIAGTAIDYYAQPKEKNTTERVVKRSQIESRILGLLNANNEVSPDDFSTKKSFAYLVDCLNKYAEIKGKSIKFNVDFWGYSDAPETTFLDIFIKGGVNYKPRVLFYAQTAYLLKNKFVNQNNHFDDWMRVVRNVVHNSTIESPEGFIGAIGLISEMSEGCSNIYDYLSTNGIKSGFASRQMEEEIRKAKIIVEHSEYKGIIFEIEDTNFCKGIMNWCLDCIDSDNANNLPKLKKVKTIIDDYFSDDDISDEFRRALLTIGDNCFYHYWGTSSYTTNTYKRRMVENTEDLKRNFTKDWRFEAYLKPLFIRLLGRSSLSSIINNYVCPQDMPNWKKRLIKEPALLQEHCQGSHYFGVTNDGNKCYLYRGKKKPASRKECTLVT